jgi:hypothetical protein
VDKSRLPRRRALIQPRVTIHSRASVLGVGASPGESPPSLPADGRGIVHPVLRFLITLLLVALALASAGAVAFGTDPALARYPSGLSWITLARRLQWPLTSLCLLLCVALIGLVIAGKRRPVWLLFLAPVLFLFYQRFAGDEFRRMAILDNPTFVGIEKAGFLKNDSLVIGLTVEGQPFAYPCGALALAPVIIHADADKRILVMYSPYAGRAQAFVVDSTIKPRELDIVSMPADALLLYNSRIGQFINGFTGTTLNGERPEGFRSPIEVRKTNWREWRTLNPDTKVLATSISLAGEKAHPRFPPRPVPMRLPPEARVTLLRTARPVLIDPSQFKSGEVLNMTAGGTNLLIFRDQRTGKLHIFDRAVKGDLFPQFTRRMITKRPEIAFHDTDTDSDWTVEGRCIAGYVKGEQLRPISMEADVSYGTLKSFYPKLEVVKP